MKRTWALVLGVLAAAALSSGCNGANDVTGPNQGHGGAVQPPGAVPPANPPTSHLPCWKDPAGCNGSDVAGPDRNAVVSESSAASTDALEARMRPVPVPRLRDPADSGWRAIGHGPAPTPTPRAMPCGKDPGRCDE